MAGGDNPNRNANPNPKSTSNPNKRPPPSQSTTTSSDHRKPRWETASSPATGKSSGHPSPSLSKPSHPSTANNNNKSPLLPHPTNTPNNPNLTLTPNGPGLGPHPPLLGPGPPRQPIYGFHMLDRLQIILADGTVRPYFALPPDYHDFPPPRPGPEPSHPFKRKLEEREWERDIINRDIGMKIEREREEFFLRQRQQQLVHFGNAGATTSGEREQHEFRFSKQMRVTETNKDEEKVDPAVFKAFLHFVKLVNDNPQQRKNFLENGKLGRLPCLACTRSTKDFPDVHGLIMHAYNSDNADLRVDHLGFHRALCVLLGYNYLRAPDNSRMYQFLPADEAAANQEDLIFWPPMVIIHNTNIGKSKKDGRMEGLGNKTMDSILRDLGFPGGKSKSLYTREGHLGITLVKFLGDNSGLKEALRLADHFEKEHHGRRGWGHVQSMVTDQDDENNPNLVTVDGKTGEKKRLLYGYLGTASDLDKLDYDTRKKIVIESKREKLQLPK